MSFFQEMPKVVEFSYTPGPEDSSEVREARGKNLMDYFMEESSSSLPRETTNEKGWSDFVHKIANSREWNTFAYVDLFSGTFEINTFRMVDGKEEAYNPIWKLPFYEGKKVIHARHTSLESLAKVYAEVVQGDYPFKYLPDPKRRMLGFIVCKKSEVAWHHIPLTAMKEYQQGYRVR